MVPVISQMLLSSISDMYRKPSQPLQQIWRARRSYQSLPRENASIPCGRTCPFYFPHLSLSSSSSSSSGFRIVRLFQEQGSEIRKGAACSPKVSGEHNVPHPVLSGDNTSNLHGSFSLSALFAQSTKDLPTFKPVALNRRNDLGLRMWRWHLFCDGSFWRERVVLSCCWLWEAAETDNDQIFRRGQILSDNLMCPLQNYYY